VTTELGALPHTEKKKFQSGKLVEWTSFIFKDECCYKISQRQEQQTLFAVSMFFSFLLSGLSYVFVNTFTNFPMLRHSLLAILW
jgi:hypothetical protein